MKNKIYIVIILVACFVLIGDVFAGMPKEGNNQNNRQIQNNEVGQQVRSRVANTVQKCYKLQKGMRV